MKSKKYTVTQYQGEFLIRKVPTNQVQIVLDREGFIGTESEARKEAARLNNK